MTEQDQGRRLGEGFGTFVYENESDDIGGDIAGVAPDANPLSPAYHVNNGQPILKGASGSAAGFPAGSYPQEIHVWIEQGQNPPFWKCWKLQFDKPIKSCNFTNMLGYQQIAVPGGCQVSALGADGTPANMVGTPEDVHTGHPPTFHA